jgi:DNA primase
MNAISDQFIEALRQTTSIEAVLAEAGVTLLGNGDHLIADCPLCHESQAFRVTPARGLWHCFGCADGGVITFVQRLHDLPLSQAVTMLAGRR